MSEENTLFRIAKITPKKVGQFVSVWKRDAESGKTRPHDITDNIDFFVIKMEDGENFGHFIFPKDVLIDKGIISINGVGGKRGIRVYPPWCVAPNKQAQASQLWQLRYFSYA
ncbi:MAG: MepB family protein [Defluviitaleaceae bacterium]|nr:MepB family protein [Defluviitaleaceae bacterium]